VPLATVITGAHRPDRKQLGDLLDARLVPCPLPSDPADPAAGPPRCLDRGDDYAAGRETAGSHGDAPPSPPTASAAQPLPPPGHPARHPPRRWVVEAGHSWVHRSRRLLIRWEQPAANSLGFVQLAAILSVYRTLRHARSLSG
jgi:putative transposase